jgi:hypothetical protein
MSLSTNKLLGCAQRLSSLSGVLLSVFLFLNSFTVFAQQIKASSRLDTNAVKIGDPVHLNLEVQHAKNIKVKWPSIPDSFSKVEVLKRSPVDTLKSDNGIVIEKQVIKLICFDPGSYTIPALSFNYKTINDSSVKTIQTDSLILIIKDIPVDTSKAIKDIKPPLEVPFSWREAIPYLIGGLAIVAVAIAVYYYLKNRKKKPGTETPVITRISAYEIALESLKKLESEKLWQQGNLKDFHSRLSDITRTYIENRFGINAMEHTTDEIMQSLQSIINNENKEKLKQVLILADLVKFAKASPIAAENELSLHNAFDFVNNSKQEPSDNNHGKESLKS